MTPAFSLLVAVATVLSLATTPVAAQSRSSADFVPVTDAMLQDPAPADWLMRRRTLDGWGYSPLDQITRANVDELRLVWSRALGPGSQQGTPLAYDGVLYMPNPSDLIQAIDATTGDLKWEYRRPLPNDLGEHLGGLVTTKRNIAIYGNLIIDTTGDDYILALDAGSGEVVWETQVLDYTKNPALQTSGPIIADGKVISGRSCRATSGPDGCVITAHDARTGEELWRRSTIPGPGEPGDETWGEVPFEERKHVGTWMVPSFDPTLNLIYIGTSVTSPAPKYGLDLRAAGRHHVARRDRRRAPLRWRCQRARPGLGPGDRRGAVGNQPRLTGHRLPDYLCRRRAAVPGGQHRHRGQRGDLPSPDA